MPEFTDTLEERTKGGVPGFVGKDENIDPDVVEEAPAAPPSAQGEGNPHAYDPSSADGQPAGF